MPQIIVLAENYYLLKLIIRVKKQPIKIRIMRWNRFWTLGFGTLLTCTLFIHAKNNPVDRKQDKPLKTIVIDAGHGGHDIGARGSYSTEKQVTLEVALKLGKIIEEYMPDVKVVYTRKVDRYDDPRLKAKIANDAKGDLFISIHCNSAAKVRKIVDYKTVVRKKGRKKVTVKQPVYAYYSSEAKGTETYIWATSKNNAKMQSLRESSVIMLDASSEEAKQVMDVSDPETFILLNTLRNVFFDQSLKLSSMVEEEFTKVGRISRGARQRNEKGIWVLQATAMPSVLVELGFISNPEEEEYLNSANGQQESAMSIFRAIKRYREELERFGNTPATTPQETVPAPPPPTPSPANTPPPTRNTTPKAVMQPVQELPVSKAATDKGSNYRIQLLVSDRDYRPGAAIFKKLKGNIDREQVVLNGKKLNKYLWGNFSREREAGIALRHAKDAGFDDAFIILFKNGVRVDM